jgi:EmrB/QacA subfamily drug resistance transporter
VPNSTLSPHAPSRIGHRGLQAALLVVTLLTAMDQTIVATALPAIVGDLGGRAAMAWVFAGYTLAMTVVMPIYGRLGDLQGRRTMFLGCLAGFVAASAACGAATSMAQLVALRCLQGLAGGGVLVMSQAVVADAVPARDRGRFLAPVGLVFATSSVVAPLLGGTITDTVGWRWIFWVNLPLGALALALAFATVPHPVGDRPHGRLDRTGSALYAVAVTGLVVTTATAGHVFAWTSPAAPALVVATLLVTALFVRRMLRHPDPLIPIGVLRNRSVAVASGLGFVVGSACFALVGYVPTVTEAVLGLPSTASGALLLALVLGMMATTTTTAHWTARTGRYRRLPLVGCLVGAAALAALSGIDEAWGVARTAVAIAALGAGVGCFMQLVVTIAQDAVPSALVGSATSTVNLVRELGATIGMAVIGTALSGRVLPVLPPLFIGLAAVLVLGALLSLLLPDRPLSRGADR